MKRLKNHLNFSLFLFMFIFSFPFGIRALDFFPSGWKGLVSAPQMVYAQGVKSGLQQERIDRARQLHNEIRLTPSPSRQSPRLVKPARTPVPKVRQPSPKPGRPATPIRKRAPRTTTVLPVQNTVVVTPDPVLVPEEPLPQNFLTEEVQDYPTIAVTSSSPQGAGIIPVSIKAQRDPFATSPAMIQEANRRGTGPVFVAGGASKVPRLTLRGYVEGTDGEEAAALIEVQGSGVFLVRKGDDISLYQGKKQNTVLKVKAINKLSAKIEVGSLGQVIVVR